MHNSGEMEKDGGHFREKTYLVLCRVQTLHNEHLL